MTKTVTFLALLLTFCLLTASAATFTVTLFQSSTIAGQNLKAGDYKVTFDNDKATLVKGKEKVEAAVKVENNTTKYDSTSVRYTDEGGKTKVKEIRLGGTTTRLVFN